MTTPVDLATSANLACEEVAARLASSAAGLTATDAAARLAAAGPNELQSHVVGPGGVLLGQLKNPLLLLLAATAAISIALQDATDATIILAIVALSVGLGFVNEFRAQRALADLHAQIRHTARVLRDGTIRAVNVGELVTGDVVSLDIGDIVPADLRLLVSNGLTCDEAAITGESLPAEKSTAANAAGTSGLAPCALMGTVVRAGSGRGIVVATGRATQFGKIATSLGKRLPETTFQRGLRDFSALLVWITAGVLVVVFPVLALIHHSFFESLLFALAIAVSLTPQLLPAIVTVSLATGARRLAKRSVLVKRLVSIEDLGNMTVLFTDKTGTLTEGRMTFAEARDPGGAQSAAVLRLAVIATAAFADVAGATTGGNVTSALDAALLDAPAAKALEREAWHTLGVLPFDYERRRSTALVDDGSQQMIVTKGAPESVLAVCASVPDGFDAVLRAQFAAGARVIAVASRPAPGATSLVPGDERDFTLAGLLAFSDPPKADAAASLARLERLGVAVKIITGDNELVAKKICSDLAIPIGGTINGAQLSAMDDAALSAAMRAATIFARVAPDQKARLIKLQLAAGDTVGFLGDGVNDAVALHDADVGISVESATDVAKDAADIVLVTKDLGILADGVVEGRRIFANTIKYVLMATSSNFGNTLSTAVGSLILPFLPMLPSQILLNNLLYDFSEMTIPTDNVDEERIARPAHWDMRLIRQFMLVFGPINALADFSIFAVMLLVFHASQISFRSGYFVESFVTQTLIIFVIRTRRVPFFRSRPSKQLAFTTLGVALIGAGLPFSPAAAFFGFTPLPPAYFGFLAAVAIAYVLVVEFVKTRFFRVRPAPYRTPSPQTA